MIKSFEFNLWPPMYELFYPIKIGYCNWPYIFFWYTYKLNKLFNENIKRITFNLWLLMDELFYPIQIGSCNQLIGPTFFWGTFRSSINHPIKPLKESFLCIIWLVDCCFNIKWAAFHQLTKGSFDIQQMFSSHYAE